MCALVAIAAVGVLVVRSRGSADLTALDRSTGARRWRIALPASGAAVLTLQNDGRIGVSPCSDPGSGVAAWYVVDPSSAKLDERRWTAADGNPPMVSVWIDPAPFVDPPSPVDEFTYDRSNGTLVSAKGWSVKVTVHGEIRHIPILVVDDSVYFVENAQQCPFRGGN